MIPNLHLGLNVYICTHVYKQTYGLALQSPKMSAGILLLCVYKCLWSFKRTKRNTHIYTHTHICYPNTHARTLAGSVSRLRTYLPVFYPSLGHHSLIV